MDEMNGSMDGRKHSWIEGWKNNRLEHVLKLLVQRYFKIKEWVKE